MGKRKRDMSYLKPFCYYCDKVFDTEIILHQHQKAKHFTCQKCQKKFSTAEATKEHLQAQHNEQMNKIPNALPGRDSVDLRIFSMQGVPKQFYDERILMGAQAYWTKIVGQKQISRKEQKVKDKAERQLLLQEKQKQEYKENPASNDTDHLNEESDHENLEMSQNKAVKSPLVSDVLNQNEQQLPISFALGTKGRMKSANSPEQSGKSMFSED